MATLVGRMAWERITQAISTGINPKASDFQIWAESQQGWHPTQTLNGTLKYIDKNGVTRLTLKQELQELPEATTLM
jgi:hypothetical protein